MSSFPPPVVSKYFTTRGVPGTGGGALDDEHGLPARCPPRRRLHRSFLECSRALRVAVESFVNEAAKKKAEYDAHEAALASILAHAEGTIESKTKELEKEKEARREEKKKTKKKKKTSVECDDDDDEGECMIDFGAPNKNANNKIDAFDDENEEARARKSIGKLLKTTLEELHRLHVNASCRCSTRSARVKEARDALTSYRRRVRECYKTIDFEGYEADAKEQQDKKRKQWEEKTDAFAKFHDNPPESIEEIRNCCELFVKNGRSPHHLCPHLCYYREYEPARQLFVLRIACCEKFGSAKKLEGWTSELALNNNTHHHRSVNGSARERSPLSRKENRTRCLSSYAANNSNSVLGSGYKSFPWKVEFKSPTGETFDTAEDVLNAISSKDDDDDDENRQRRTNPQGISFPRSSHGGSGRRLPGVKEHGLEQDVEILRAALWSASEDHVHASSPVKLRRLEAETEGYERSPVQLAPPGKGFVESCGDVVTLKVIDNYKDGENDEDDEYDYEYDDYDYDDDDRSRYSESEYGAEDDEGGGYGRKRRRRRRRREDARQHQDAFDGYFFEDDDDEEEEEEKEVVEIVHREKGEEKNIEVKVKEEPIIIAHNDENESGGNHHRATIKKERKFKTTAGTGSEGGEEKKIRLAQLNETKMKHSFHSSKLLKLESEPPLVSKFDDERCLEIFASNADASLERKRVSSSAKTMMRHQSTGTGPRHFVVPPRSPFGLLEEILWRDDWKLLTACMMLNCTTRLQVDRVLWELFTLAPTAEDAVKLGETERGIQLIEKCLATIGLHRKRARAFVRLSKDVVEARRGKESALLRLNDGNGSQRDGKRPLASTEGENEDDRNNESLPPSPNTATGTAAAGAGADDDDDDDDDTTATANEDDEASAMAPPSGGSKFVRSVSEFHGVGAYAADAHAMFCDGVIAAPPRDHALRWYYAFALERESEKLSKNVLFLKN